jgi:hypothetical protein
MAAVAMTPVATHTFCLSGVTNNATTTATAAASNVYKNILFIKYWVITY